MRAELFDAAETRGERLAPRSRSICTFCRMRNVCLGEKILMRMPNYDTARKPPPGRCTLTNELCDEIIL